MNPFTRREFLVQGTKWAGAAIMATSMGGLLSACAKVTGAGAANLVFLNWDTTQKLVIDQQLQQFKQAYPNDKVTLNLLANNDYWQKLPIDIAGGSGPDLFIMTRPNLEVFAKSNQVADIQSFVDKSTKLQGNLNAMDSRFVDTYKYNGRTRGIPLGVDSTAIAFNKTLFQKEGLKLPTDIENTWTWDDLREYAIKLTKRSGDASTQYGFYVGTGGHVGWWELLWSNGGEIFDSKGEKCLIASPQGKQAIQFLADLMLKDKVSLSPSLAQSQDVNSLFISGKIAMMHVGDWNMAAFQKIKDFEWDVVELPFSPYTKKRITTSNVIGYVVNPNSKFKDETLHLIEQLTSQESQKIYATTGIYIPARKDVQDPFFQGQTPKNLKAFQRALSYAHPMAFGQWISYQEIIRITGDALTQILSGKISVDQGWQGAQDQINSVIQQNMAKG
ncbi:MAG: sugar transporter substrate-binding protein [Bacilli bacterium]|nr:sugar transporter substrate-binding protein [Bacilli bacterium]